MEKVFEQADADDNFYNTTSYTTCNVELVSN